MIENIDEIEKRELFKPKLSNNHHLIFNAKGSAGRNPQKLAQICSTFDFVINLLGWQKKPLANLSDFLTKYQASIDAKYHNDFKDVLIAEEIERKRASRRGINIMQGGSNAKD